jgi:putative tryptophan/tyrosine transport system substrate-binding protein
MKRRAFMVSLTAGALWPLVAAGQPTRKPRQIGFLAGGARPPRIEGTLYEGFLQGMRQLGYMEGKDFVVEWRFAEGEYDRFPQLAAELVRLNVEVIVLGAMAAVRATQRATNTIPIVMGNSIDPVGNGLVASLARPGGNTTGLSSAFEDYIPKLLELLQMTVPRLSRLAILINPTNEIHASILKYAEEPAAKAKLSIVSTTAASSQELEGAFEKARAEGAQAIVVPADALFYIQRQRLGELAIKHGLPSVFAQRDYVQVGGLMSYGENLADFYRRTATFVDKLLNGSKAGELPVEQPTRYLLVINRKTAETLGLTIPDLLLTRADEVIE